ncbi:hypothetical protein ACWF94_40840 [Streptomyces sp. NPDC055078]
MDGTPGHRPRPPRAPHSGPPRVRERTVPDQPAHRPPGRGDRPAQEGPGVPAVHLRTAVGRTVGPAQASRGRLGHFIVTGPDPAAPGPGPEREATRAP